LGVYRRGGGVKVNQLNNNNVDQRAEKLTNDNDEDQIQKVENSSGRSGTLGWCGRGGRY
jgi:hypothetical protein